MALYLFSNGDMPLVESINKTTTPSLCYYYKDGTKYIPLITKTGTVNIGKYVYSYTTARPTVHTIYNNTEYVVPNDYKTIAEIPAGMYSPSTFESIIANFISQNGSRTVKNSFSVIVDGQTYDVPAGRAICYTSQYAGTARFVTFSGKQRDSETFEEKQFSTQGVYCVYWKHAWSGQGNTYKNFDIYVTQPIIFY